MCISRQSLETESSRNNQFDGQFSDLDKWDQRAIGKKGGIIPSCHSLKKAREEIGPKAYLFSLSSKEREKSREQEGGPLRKC